jgi:glycosyltransferase involved in cell wall biosynthesis
VTSEWSGDEGIGLSEASPERVSISLVIPTLNEAANLPHVLTRIPTIVDEVLLVDGHSVDDTVAVARAIRPEIRVLLQRSQGKGNALACGFAAATGDIIVMLDADGSTDPAELPLFVEVLLNGSDFAKGSRFVEGGRSADITRVRATGNRFLNIAVNLLFRTRYTDLCYGYNAFWRHCLPHMRVTSSGFEVETLINVRIARAGLLVTEVPSVEYERIHGESKLNAARDGMRALSVIIRERMSRNAFKRSDDWQPPFHELPRSTDPQSLESAVDSPMQVTASASHSRQSESRPAPEMTTLEAAGAGGPAV